MHAVSLVFVAATLFSGAALAQGVAAYPTKPVKIVITLAAGGSNDIVARLFAQKLSDQLKQPFLVENRAGGSGIPGTDYVAKAAPDGYTLLLGNTTGFGIQPSLFSRLPYDIQRDFVPISILTLAPSVMVVNASLEPRSVGELVGFAKTRSASSRTLNYGSPGNGSPYHLSAELFKARTAFDMVHVPYKGVAPELVDLLAGRIQIMFANVPEVIKHIRSGELRALAITGTARTALLPEVPTLAEAGVQKAESLAWFVLVAPRGTPREVIARLNTEVVRAEGQPDLRERLHELSFEPVGNSADEAEAFMREERDKWARVVRDSGAKVDD